MAATLTRHHGSYARPQKTLPIAMPSTKTPSAYSRPVSRVALEPPELSDTSTVYSSRRSGGTLSDISDEYESRLPGGIDVMDELSERMNTVFDPMKMDRSIARQAQTSGELNAKQRELADLQAQMQRRIKKTRVNFDTTLSNVEEARSDLKYSKEKIAAMKARAMKEDPDAYESARKSRHSRR
ncbi:hypothetical protein LTR64_008002 [Lithohypha guttulata]|uniref:Biogenesis of lysosome-related organelles complex 1 subunit KXD1 n=1 Tax=Lithohypha guttulata TaxID=1690604 RepID=A0AAN7SYJ7_9EURO|nr:hypothetical protein LTR51_008129 [Lithohypha guttulata]KAK5084677.1 hypothetical protein LTR05_005755 [Lithohypha guttulata]